MSGRSWSGNALAKERIEPPREASPSFAVVVPMFNEEAGARRCVEAIVPQLLRLPCRSALYVVDDGSRDATAGILAECASERPTLKVVSHETNHGYGAALRTGVEKAAQDGYQYVLFMDSDLTNDPADIPRFVERMAQGFDVIKATRYSLGGGAVGVPIGRVLVSWLGNKVARILFGLPIHDCTNGFRAVRLALLERMPLRTRNFSLIMEELYYARAMTSSFCEIPVSLTNRGKGQRKTSFRYRPRVFWDYLKFPLRAALDRSLGRSGGATPEC